MEGGLKRAGYGVVIGVPLILLLVFLGWLTRPHESFVRDALLGNAVLALPTLICLGRAVLVRAQRVVFTLIGLGAAGFTAGNIVYIAYVQYLDPVPYPSVADLGYLAPYPLLFAAVVALAYPELKGSATGPLLDGLLGALVCACMGSVITLGPVLRADEGSWAARALGAAYPVADLTLAALIVAVLTLKRDRPGWTWICLGAGVVVFAVADTTYLYRLAEDTYTVGTPLDGLWAVALNLLALAAVVPYRPGRPATAGSSTRLMLPNIFSFVTVGVLIYGSISVRALPIYVVVLSALTLLTAVKRIAVGFSALRMLGESERQARTDELTQLSNRRHFDEQAQQAFAARRPEQRLALMLVDLDGFKAINDTLGHHAGDELLRQIGPRLQRHLGPGDLLARLGGDEFAILVRGTDGGTARGVAEQMQVALAEPFLLDGVIQTVGASLGIALCPDHGTDLTVLMQRSDLAMFDAKANETQVTVYDPQRLGGGVERFNVKEALTRHELFVEYQPQIDARGAIYGVEALVRWRHPERGLVSPARFLPFFEQAGLMADLTLYVLELGARDWKRWRLGGDVLRLSVNLAPSALLADDLIPSIAAVLEMHGLPSEMLTLEITESVPLAVSERSNRALDQLASLGIELSLDDFGTGWCSLSYLCDLPVSEVKIDQTFVFDLVAGSAQAAVISSIVDLAARFGLRAVAEGVETAPALAILEELGVRHFQGFFLGRPMPAADVPGAVRRTHQRPVSEHQTAAELQPASERRPAPENSSEQPAEHAPEQPAEHPHEHPQYERTTPGGGQDRLR